MSAYQSIEGVVYQSAILEMASQLSGEAIDLRLAKRLYAVALNQGMVTAIEARSLSYLLTKYRWTEEAQVWLQEQLKTETATQRTAKRVIRELGGYVGLRWELSDDEIEAQEALGSVSFGVALYEVLEAFVFQMESSFSLRDVVSLETKLDLEDQAAITAKIRAYLNQATLYILPTDYAALIETGNLNLAIPEDARKIEDYWIVGLKLTALSSYLVFGYVSRTDLEDTYVHAQRV